MGDDVTANDFVSYGITTILSGASFAISGAPPALGGGSVTEIRSGAAFVSSAAISVAGALVRNFGSFGGNVVADYGATVTGPGVYGTVATRNGGVFSPGASPGGASLSGFDVAGGGAFLFEIANATGTAGDVNGWDMATVAPNVFSPSSAAIALAASAANTFTIFLSSRLDDGFGNTAGPAVNFNPAQNYAWKFLDGSHPATAVTGSFDPAAFQVVVGGFVNAFTGTFSVELRDGGKNLYLVYDAPDPVVTAIAPFVGPTTGFTVQITGTGFLNATTVTFGTTDVAIPANASNTTIVVAAPNNHAVGNVTVTVIGPNGTSTPTTLTSGVDQITYRPTKQTGVVIGDGSAQRSVVRSITVNFDGLIDSAPASAFTITDQANNPIAGLTVGVAGVGTNALTLTFTDSNAANVGPVAYGSLADGRYRLKIDGSFLTSGSVPVDADGNGSPGGVSATDFGRLFGDANGNGFVDATDLYPFLVNSIDKGLGDVGYNPAFDFNNNGFVDATDIYPEIVTRIDTGL